MFAKIFSCCGHFDYSFSNGTWLKVDLWPVSGPGHSRGLLPEPVPGLGVLSLPSWSHAHQEPEPGSPGHRRVRGTARQTRPKSDHHHPEHRRAAPPGRLPKPPGDPRWEQNGKPAKDLAFSCCSGSFCIIHCVLSQKTNIYSKREARLNL